VSLLPFVGTITNQQSGPFSFVDYLSTILITFLFGIAIIFVDIAMPKKRLSSVFGIYLGIGAGLLGALAIGAIIDLIANSWNLNDERTMAYLGLAKLAIGITLCFLAVSVVLTTKDDFRLVIPYVEFSRQVRGVRPMVLDTSMLIDGRIEQIGSTGFLDAPLILPQFVIDELHRLSDSNDKLKRERGRRGLAVVTSLQQSTLVNLTLDEAETNGEGVDTQLLEMARRQNLRILTTDYNLNHVAKIHGVTVLNINDLTSSLQTQSIPGDTLRLEIIRRGDQPGQGVAFMPDGTMVVIDDAGDRIGELLVVTVTNALQTSAGKMIFATLSPDNLPGKGVDTPTRTQHLKDAATGQPRISRRPDSGPSGQSQHTTRNPRR